MAVVTMADYHNRYDKTKHWDEILYRAGKSVQSAEFNEMQALEKMRLKMLADAIFSDGQIISGCDATVDGENHRIQLGAGRLYLDGQVREIESATLDLEMIGSEKIGVILEESIITENDDASLRSPALGAPDYNKAGAARLVVIARWITEAEAVAIRSALLAKAQTQTLTNTELMQLSNTEKFYPIYTVNDGVLINASAATATEDNISAILVNLARYDRESHGSYVANGLSVRAIEAEQEGTQEFSISEGHAHVNGYEVTLPHSARLVVPEEMAKLDIEAEVHNFIGDGNHQMRVNLHHSPIDHIERVSVTFEATESVLHGSYTGCLDALSHNSIVKIISITQGSTTFVQGTDYRLTTDKVDWSPSGAEPSPSSQYLVTYQYRTYINPASTDTTGFTLMGVVDDSQILVDYSYRLPRKDLIVLARDGTISLVKGVSHQYSPAVPDTPPDTLCLAHVTQNWVGLPKVENIAVQAVQMSTLQSMQNDIVRAFNLIARQELKADAIASAPSSVGGVFVDPFLDDDMRDAGIEQTALIANNCLTLPLDVQDVQFGLVRPEVLNLQARTILAQTARTGSMQINPYQAFDPLPIKMSLNPSVDHWTTQESGGIIQDTVRQSRFVGGYSTTFYRTSSTTQDTALTSNRADTNLRVRNVQITASGLGAGEFFDVFFDGRKVISHGVADTNGEVNRTFTIPAGLPVGTKLVELKGSVSRGSATYIGSGTIVTTTIKRTTIITTTCYDPLAQTFILDESRHIVGVNVWFTKKGTSSVRAQIREVALGYPTEIVLAEGEIAARDIVQGRMNRINFDFPVFLNADTMYAVTILSDTSDHELAIAELGKFDSNVQKYVTGQPYAAGTLLSSSNAATWTPHQNADLCFELIGAEFADTQRVISLGTVEMTDVTDLLPSAEIETTGMGTDVTFIIEDAQGREAARVQANQALALSDKLNGTYTVKAELTGSEKLSPVLYGGVQLLTGALQNSGTYVSRAFACGSNKKLYISLDTYTPGSSRIDVAVQTGANTYTDATAVNYTELGDGWRTVDYECLCSLENTRIKITLAGSPSERPFAVNLKAVICNA